MAPKRKLCMLAGILSATLPACGSGAPSVIRRDVCVIGGGSSGTYAAVRLRQMGRSVALIERESRMGGHVNTYVDPVTNQTYDYGVEIFSNISVVNNYFQHFDIPLLPDEPSPSISKYVDFETGEVVPATDLATGNLTDALTRYGGQEAKYPAIFNKWDLPNPVPEDLLIPFGDFIKKYNLSAFAYTAYLYNQGAGNILDQPTLYMMKYFDRQQVHDLLTGGFLMNGHHDNQQLYDRALAEMGSDAFLSSTVHDIMRRPDQIDIFVTTPDGPKLITASKLLISIPPKLTNLQFLDLDGNDRHLFGQFNNSYYWDAMIRNTGIPPNTSLTNADPKMPYNIPRLPGTYTFQSTPIPDVYAAYYSSPGPMSDQKVKADMIATLARLRKGLGYPEPAHPPEFVGFNNHSPFELTVSKEAIQNGFYERLEALQGKRNTWWTGAAWLNQASSTLWNFTEYQILPNLVA